MKGEETGGKGTREEGREGKKKKRKERRHGWEGMGRYVLPVPTF